MKSLPTLKIRKNLFISGNYVISYDTKVAKIKDNKLYELGKYSRTTSKHIYHIAWLFKLELVRNDKKQVFWKYEMGDADCTPCSTFLSPTTSSQFLGEENDFDSIVNRLAKIDFIPKKDQTVINRFLESNDFPVESFERLRKALRLIEFA
jgi:hypothetical protein